MNAQVIELQDAQYLEFHPTYRTPKTGDERLAALCGYMTGDGTIAYRQPKGKRRDGTEVRYKANFNGAFYSNYKRDLEAIQNDVMSLGMGFPSVTRKKVKQEWLDDGYQIQISQNACKLLVEAGVPYGKKTTTDFRVPSWIMNGSLDVKRFYISALFGAEGSTPAWDKSTKGRMPRNVVLSMCKIEPFDGRPYFDDLQSILKCFGIQSTIRNYSKFAFNKHYIYHTLVVSSLDTLRFFEEIGYTYAHHKSIEAWKWSKYIKAYNQQCMYRERTVVDLRNHGMSFYKINKILKVVGGGCATSILDTVNRGGEIKAGHTFPHFAEWLAERWDEDRQLLRLNVVSKKTREQKESVFNVSVSSHDHSYLLANGANNFNSFESMSGRVYYPFDRQEHVGEYEFNEGLPIWIGMDFNIDPMSAIILQPQPSGEVWVVDEVVRFGSNTEEICEALDEKYYKYQAQTIMYPDPASGQRQHARGETDLDIMREKGFKRIKVRKRHPAIADRVNSVNRMLRSADGNIRLRINKSCKHLINSLEQTIYKPGGREIDKAPGIEHSADALGYCIEYEFPLRKVDVCGVSI